MEYMQPSLFDELPAEQRQPLRYATLEEELAEFDQFMTRTIASSTPWRDEAGIELSLTTYINEFWTSAQRAALRIHEISYRACFKPALPRFFIERMSKPGDVVYDPFMGRGTTLLEAAALGRVPWGTDVNPLSVALAAPRLEPPNQAEIEARLAEYDLTREAQTPEDLLVFYHPDTLREIGALREEFLHRGREGTLDAADRWIRMVALNRLTGHSPGFFSVYTLPPNQATSVKAQLRINERRNQTPPRRDVRAIIRRKSAHLLSDMDANLRRRMAESAAASRLVTAPADRTPSLPDASVDLVITSPPFLDVAQYASDNWLRLWFLDVDPASIEITMARKVETWAKAMRKVFRELARVLKPGGHVVFEVGEARGGSIKLEEWVIPAGAAEGLQPRFAMINAQEFTKTANCWGVDNGKKGTNTNRIVVFSKPG